MIDIICPNGNEPELVKQAEKLGYTELIIIGKKKDTKSTIKLKFTDKIEKATQKLRAQVENPKTIAVYDLEHISKKDYIHHRGSGINHVIANLMAQRNISAIVNLRHLLYAEPKARAKAMGRIAQNADIFRKKKVKFLIASFATQPLEMRSPKDLIALVEVMGFDNTQAKEAVSTCIF